MNENINRTGFQQHISKSKQTNYYNVLSIKGLSYIINFTTAKEEEKYLKLIIFNCQKSQQFLDIPPFLKPLVDSLIERKIFTEIKSIVINSFEAEEPTTFIHQNQKMAMLSLSSDYVLDFTNKKSNEKKSLVIKRNSLVIFENDAYYNWVFNIAGRKVDRGYKDIEDKELIIHRGHRILILFTM